MFEKKLIFYNKAAALFAVLIVTKISSGLIMSAVDVNIPNYNYFLIIYLFISCMCAVYHNVITSIGDIDNIHVYLQRARCPWPFLNIIDLLKRKTCVQKYSKILKYNKSYLSRFDGLFADHLVISLNNIKWIHSYNAHQNKTSLDRSSRVM